MFENDSKKLIDDILNQAKHFLNEADEFYPFGAVIEKKGNLRSVGVNMDEEFPDVQVVFAELEKGLEEGLSQDLYRHAAIGFDVFINVKKGTNSQEKVTAIEIRLFTNTCLTRKHFIYEKQASGYAFTEYFLDD